MIVESFGKGKKKEQVAEKGRKSFLPHRKTTKKGRVVCQNIRKDKNVAKEDLFR